MLDPQLANLVSAGRSHRVCISTACICYDLEILCMVGVDASSGEAWTSFCPAIATDMHQHSMYVLWLEIVLAGAAAWPSSS